MHFPKNILSYSVLLLASVTFSSFDSNNNKLSYKLSQKIRYQNPDERNLVWIFFTDKGPETESRLSDPESFLTQESIQRRLKRVKSESKFDDRDIPVYHNYLSRLTEAGVQIKRKSKWFNGVSCYIDRSGLETISDMDFVRKIDMVQKYSRNTEEVFEFEFELDHMNSNPNSPTDFDYGRSLNQSQIINVPPVHNLGYNGNGVLIASFDAGFDNLQHPCFELIRSKGLRTYDFVNGDTIVANGTGRLGDGRHGTLTLSLVCGYEPGFLVSPAFNSRFILAKTENTVGETRLEEDNWIAAAEWADSLGADIITSSLGYDTFDPPYESYTWEMMDGNTPLITRAADLAVSKGIVVVISSGNSGYNQHHNTLSAPADGDSVITVGSVNSSRVRADYSSVGPTADGRIKPDVMAMGSNNYTARFGAGNTGYTAVYTGTSLACPMVAAVCALMLTANPDLTPIQIRDILRNTADNSHSPNNLVGWGIVDAYSAIRNATNAVTTSPVDYQLLQNYPNPFNPSTSLRFNLNKSANVSIVIYDIRGKEVDRAVDNKFYPVGTNNVSYSNSNLSSGVYFYSMSVNGVFIESKKMILVY